MFLLISALLLIFAGQCSSHQTLTCSYTSEQKTLPRVWCKRDVNDHSCCTGFSFQGDATQLAARGLSVQDNGKDFVVSVNNLSQGDGVYWCGVTNGTNTIIKLAETQLYTTPPWFIWDILRWVVFALLLLAVISTSVYSNRKAAKQKEDPYEYIMEEKQR